MECKLCKYKFLCKNYNNKCERYEKEEYTELIKKENGTKEIKPI